MRRDDPGGVVGNVVTNRANLEQIVSGLHSALNALEHLAAGNQIEYKSTLRTVREALFLAESLWQNDI